MTTWDGFSAQHTTPGAEREVSRLPVRSFVSQSSMYFSSRATQKLCRTSLEEESIIHWSILSGSPGRDRETGTEHSDTGEAEAAPRFDQAGIEVRFEKVVLKMFEFWEETENMEI